MDAAGHGDRLFLQQEGRRAAGGAVADGVDHARVGRAEGVHSLGEKVRPVDHAFFAPAQHVGVANGGEKHGKAGVVDAGDRVHGGIIVAVDDGDGIFLRAANRQVGVFQCDDLGQAQLALAVRHSHPEHHQLARADQLCPDAGVGAQQGTFILVGDIHCHGPAVQAQPGGQNRCRVAHGIDKAAVGAGIGVAEFPLQPGLGRQAVLAQLLHLQPDHPGKGVKIFTLVYLFFCHGSFPAS